MLNVGIIGFGKRINDIWGKMIALNEVRISAITDLPGLEDEKLKMAHDLGFTDVRYYTDADEMFKNEKLDGVFIGTRCNEHTHFAELTAKYKVPMFLEKPVAITWEQLKRLETLDFMDDLTVVSFPLRITPIVKTAKEIIDSGKLGEIAHVQAYNNVPYGRCYYHKWYRDDSITGGLFLQKATHDLDYVNYLIGDNKPVRVCAVESKQIFKGNKPADLKCSTCPDAKTCTESPENLKKFGDRYINGELCCYSTATGNQDSGSVIIQYQNGMHTVYSQDFLVRGGAGKRGARIIGYLGTLEFDWYTGKITVYRHLENIVEEYTVNTAVTSHFGGDMELYDNFINVMKGKDVSRSPLRDGIESARLCLAAKESASSYKFIEL